jgi:hypothetical protein
MTYLEELAAMARVGENEAYYGTLEQITAENDFFDLLDLHLAGMPIEEREAFDAFCSKATCDERIDEGLRLAALCAARG